MDTADDNNTSPTSSGTVSTGLKIHGVLLNFFSNRQKMLVNLYIENWTNSGDGVMLLTLSNITDNVAVRYIPIQYIPKPIDEDIKARYRKNNYDRNIIYFVLASPEAENIIEMDLLQSAPSLAAEGATPTS